MQKLVQVFRDSGKIAWLTILATITVLMGSSVLLLNAAEARYERDIHRIGFNENWELLDEIRKQAGVMTDSLEEALEASAEPPKNQAYLVVSIEDRRVWYKIGDSTIYTTQVAVGSGKELVREGEKGTWKFETPRGRLVVQAKEEDPMWIPPDWHFVELARKKGLGVVKLTRGQAIPVADGSTITVQGNDVVKRSQDGRAAAFDVEEDREIIVGGNVIIPPFGTNQRKYAKVLGTHRLVLGDGYALHGTNKPESIGQAVSHGCIRLRNEDIEHLYGIVAVGTPVFIY
ncbi:MAG: L,D-transpeptidase [Anaerolineae bacterium]|nr:L,D-transpeptidase [Gemmatimonadaceae bacterium]